MAAPDAGDRISTGDVRNHVEPMVEASGSDHGCARGMYFVYILRTTDDRLYIGHTGALEPRMWQHADRSASVFTADHAASEVVYLVECQTRDEAFGLERRLKKWSRAKKEALIAGDWARLHLLARRRGGRPSTARGASRRARSG